MPLEGKEGEMRVMEIQSFGGPEVLQRGRTARPIARPGRGRRACDGHEREPGRYEDPPYRPGVAPALPAVLGADVAGTIAAVGAGVTAFAPGDEVYGCAGGVTGMNGALAEYLLTDPALLAPKPPQLSWREAAALPLVTITAWEGLFDRAHIARARVCSSSPARAASAISPCSWPRPPALTSSRLFPATTRAALARSLGADAVVDHRRERAG